MKLPFDGRVIDFRPWLIAIVVLGTFAVGIRNQFVWDDFDFIVRNSYIHDLGNVPRFLFSGDAEGTGFTNPYYRPLTTASFALDYSLWGERPAGFHATNVALHLLVCLVLYQTIRRITDNKAASMAATLLFAVHPAHSEPVGYISSRADILCGLFMLLSFFHFLRSRETGERRFLAISLFSFALALLSKIVALMLLPLLAVYLIMNGNRDKWARTLVPFVVVSIAFLVLRSWVLTIGGWGGQPPFPVRAANAGFFFVSYIRHALLPVGLRVFYDLPLIGAVYALPVIASWGGLICIGGAVVFLARRRPLLSFGIVWFFAALLPVCGLVTILFPAFIADRYLYIPLLGLAIAVASLLKDLVPPNRSRKFCSGAFAVVGIMVLAGSVGTAFRLLDWRNSLTLWSAAVEDAPGSLYAKNGLGAAYMDIQSFDAAERILKEVIAIRDDSAQPRINLAGIEFKRGNLDKMEIHVNRALELRPTNFVALTYLGIIKARKGWTDEAMLLFREAIRLNPRYEYARENLEIIQRHLPSTRVEKPAIPRTSMTETACRTRS